MGMAYDAQDGYVLLFGGYGVNEVLGDTWSFVGGLWTELSPLPSPSPREAPMMTYDDPGGTVILFGGSTYLPDPSPPHQLNDTWSFAGGSWTELTPGSAPAARGAGAIAYDATDSCSLLFGGTEQLGTAGNQNDTGAGGNAPPLVGLSILVDPSMPLPGAVGSFGASFPGGGCPFTYARAFGRGRPHAPPHPLPPHTNSRRWCSPRAPPVPRHSLSASRAARRVDILPTPTLGTSGTAPRFRPFRIRRISLDHLGAMTWSSPSPTPGVTTR